ncbi:MAG: GNAT family N-acetyltransferase, partial [Candidatus Limnocylindrales bacterium]
PQAGEMGDVFDIGAREGDHPTDDSGHMLSPRSPRPLLRPMTPADVVPVSTAILADDWGDRRAWFEFVVAHPGCDAVVAEVDGIVVGTGVTTRNGPVAWIGTIWVAAAWRGQGLGRILTQATMDIAETAGCRTLVLVATSSGQPLYERMGFRVRTWYRTMEATGRLGAPDAPDRAAPGRRNQIVRAFRTDDLAAMVGLDAGATGEDRAHLLSAFATEASTRIVAGPDDVARGFMIRAPWGGGATIAPDPHGAMALLDARRDAYPTHKKVRAGVLETNGVGIARLEADGWTVAWRAPRLELGESLDWDPAAIWGQFNHALG